MASLPYIRSAKLRAIAVSTVKRTAALPQLPTIAESGVPGYATGSWYGLLAPVSVSTKVVNFLHLEFSKIIQNNEFKERLISEGSDPVGSTPYEFKLHIRQELTRWASVIDRAQIKIE
jgi:tripartite-type tricarboxylate transporter receptor subunit TctC